MTALALSQGRVVSGHTDGRLRVWSADTLQAPRDLQFSPLNLWDMASGAMQSVPTKHNGLLTSIAFRPDGRYLATLGAIPIRRSAFSTRPTSAW